MSTDTKETAPARYFDLYVKSAKLTGRYIIDRRLEMSYHIE